jgi:hypothetical protein
VTLPVHAHIVLNDGTAVEQREEAPVPQPRQDPAPDNLDPDLDFRFVARLVRTAVEKSATVAAG